MWKFVRNYDCVAGDFMWTGIDYLLRIPLAWQRLDLRAHRYLGRFKKAGFYFDQSQWTAKPMLHLFPHWNWKGREDRFILVTRYTNCDTVELFINGKSAGVK